MLPDSSREEASLSEAGGENVDAEDPPELEGELSRDDMNLTRSLMNDELNLRVK